MRCSNIKCDKNKINMHDGNEYDKKAKKMNKNE